MKPTTKKGMRVGKNGRKRGLSQLCSTARC